MNAGWWLYYFLPAAVAISVLGAAAILIARRNGWPLEPIAIAMATFAAIAGLGSVFLARRRFFSVHDAFARLDLALGLFNRLTSAAEGIGRWPERRPMDPIRWRVQPLWWPPVLSAAVIAGAVHLPLERSVNGTALDRTEPLAWTEIEEIVTELAQEETLDPMSLEDWRERLAELRRQPEEQWFEHSSLEAGDHLRDQLDSSLSKMERDLLRADQTLEQMRTSDPATSDSQSMEHTWQQAMKDLELGKLRLDPELSKELAELDPSQARELTPEEMAKLKEALKKGVKKVRLARGEGGEESDLLVLMQGQGKLPGQGGASRGRADADLTLRPDPTDASTGESQNLASKDLTNAALGDVVGLSPKDHEIDPKQWRGRSTSGGVGSKSQGGEAVWKSSLPPVEQEFLERYFE